MTPVLGIPRSHSALYRMYKFLERAEHIHVTEYLVTQLTCSWRPATSRTSFLLRVRYSVKPKLSMSASTTDCRLGMRREVWRRVACMGGSRREVKLEIIGGY